MLNKIKSKLLKSMFDALFNKTSNSPTIHGDKTRLHIGNNVSLVNALINLSSGSVFIGNNSKFGHNCMLLTGKHSYGNSPKSNLRTVLEWHGIIFIRNGLYKNGKFKFILEFPQDFPKSRP